ncbi:RNA polymerase sigma factor [Acidicapsa dinghuensis]|uniref:RNA polymerase sigma factor n=1 Tax=Acidicapsa dinghuensis TaxID=2218256 RepID=A0ABW1ED40_9BACT|nr:sigma-70 family RNA polymerase sigma factor [Acidicapsa dinghuensis]
MLWIPCGEIFAYLELVGITPSQPVSISAGEDSIPSLPDEPHGALTEDAVHELFEFSGGSAYKLPRGVFEAMLTALCEEQARSSGVALDPAQRVVWLRSLRLNEIVLARACAQGHEEAWNYFLERYSQPVLRAAMAITGNETLAADLADNLYAELYGLNLRDGERRSPLASYQGRGSLLGWLRTILAQRFVDHYRRTGREQPLECESRDGETSRFDPPAKAAEAVPDSSTMSRLSNAIQAALEGCDAEDRFLLASYYLDQRTLLEISRILHVHEATISRRLHRTTERLHKELLRHLQSQGLSKRAADEALGADPRDIELNLRQLLQTSSSQAFPQEEGQ